MRSAQCGIDLVPRTSQKPPDSRSRTGDSVSENVDSELWTGVTCKRRLPRMLAHDTPGKQIDAQLQALRR